MTRRARGLLLLGLCALCGGLSASLVNGYAKDVRRQVGPLVPVVVARSNLPPSTLLTPGKALELLVVRRVPARFVPPDSLSSTADAVGLLTASALPAGSYVGRSQLRLQRDRNLQGRAAAIARTVEVAVAGTSSLRDALRPGARVDVLVTSDAGTGPARTYLALQPVELLDVGGRQDGAASGSRDADATATLRVSLRQAVLLTAAQNFAREVRLVPRPERDDRLLRGAVTTSADLRP